MIEGGRFGERSLARIELSRLAYLSACYFISRFTPQRLPRERRPIPLLSLLPRLPMAQRESPRHVDCRFQRLLLAGVISFIS